MRSGSATGSNNLMGLASGNAGACGLTNRGTNQNNIFASDPLLAALADNGCATPSGSGGACVRTHALQTGSPAIDAGSNTKSLPNDQRGLGDRVVGSTADIGAFESGASDPPTAGAGSVGSQTPTVNQAFTYTTPADLFDDDSGGAMSLALKVTGLPSRLIATDNGDGTVTISGTPTETGTFTVTITATDVDGKTFMRTFTMTVQASTAATPIPTLGVWSLALAGGLLAVIGGWRRRRQ